MKPTAFNYADYEKLQAENATLKADLAAAVEDMNHIAKKIANCNQFLSGGEDRVNSLKLGRCDVCKGICNEDKPCNWQWRGPQEAGKGEAK